MGKSNLFAVFGNPILHSKSPQLFNAAFSGLQSNDFYTRVLPISAKNIVEIIRSLPLSGANITAPFKQEIFDFVDFTADDAKKIGAINTIVNENGRLIGHNTDHYGVTESLLNAGVSLTKSRCLVLGAGGAARAAVYGLINKGAEVTICNRTQSKAEIISSDFGCRTISWNDFDTNEEFDIVVSTLLPEANPSFLEDIEFDYFLDASYKGSVASDIAIENGAKVIPGEKWLLFQAAQAFKLFTEMEPPVRTMEQGLQNTLTIDNLTIGTTSQTSIQEIISKRFDLLVDSSGLAEEMVKQITDEEISKAFGS